MAATGKVPVHPSQYSPEVIEALRTFIRPGSRVHDPYAGTGVRLGKLCDELQCKFSGTDIERWSVMDRRIKVADANDGRYYPKTAFTVVTSPVYLNKRMGDYAEGPLETTNVRGRRDYGISLGRPLHPNNLARYTGKPKLADAYWFGHGQPIQWWDEEVILNVDAPISAEWAALMRLWGYEIVGVVPVFTRRYRGLDNAELRAPNEVIILCRLA